MPRRATANIICLFEKLTQRAAELRVAAARLPDGDRKTDLLRNAEQCEIAVGSESWLGDGATLARRRRAEPEPFSFEIDQIAAGHWCIKAARAGCQPIVLTGIYTSREAAVRRLPEVSRRWLEALDAAPVDATD